MPALLCSPSSCHFFFLQTEIISFSERNKEFTAINTEVLAISTDSHHTHLAWTRSKREDGGVGRLNIPLVADTSKKISASYGVLVTDESDDMFGAGKTHPETLDFCCISES
jgi:alkyl hydroperoxide reductase subunit AhpC